MFLLNILSPIAIRTLVFPTIALVSHLKVDSVVDRITLGKDWVLV